MSSFQTLKSLSSPYFAYIGFPVRVGIPSVGRQKLDAKARLFQLIEAFVHKCRTMKKNALQLAAIVELNDHTFTKTTCLLIWCDVKQKSLKFFFVFPGCPIQWEIWPYGGREHRCTVAPSSSTKLCHLLFDCGLETYLQRCHTTCWGWGPDEHKANWWIEHDMTMGSMGCWWWKLNQFKPELKGPTWQFTSLGHHRHVSCWPCLGCFPPWTHVKVATSWNSINNCRVVMSSMSVSHGATPLSLDGYFMENLRTSPSKMDDWGYPPWLRTPPSHVVEGESPSTALVPSRPSSRPNTPVDRHVRSFFFSGGKQCSYVRQQETLSMYQLFMEVGREQNVMRTCWKRLWLLQLYPIKCWQ